MKKDTKQILLDAAIQVFAKNPGAPMTDIADAAGVGRATLYRHYPSREALIREITINSYKQTNDAVNPVFSSGLTGTELLMAFLEAIIPLGDKYYFLLLERSLDDDPEIADFVSTDQKEWLDFCDHLKNKKVIDREVPTAWFSAATEALVYAAWESIHKGDIAPNDAAAFVHRTLVMGLGPAGTK